MPLSWVLSVLCAAAPATPAPAATDGPLVPWFVPRSVQLGLFINDPMLAPHFRIAWEGAIIDQPRNVLIWTAAFGSGIGANLPKTMTSHYQHAAVAGFGYRFDGQLIHWGFHAAAGAVWYRTSFVPGSIYKFEDRLLGYVEGRIQLGLRVTPHLRVALYFGYASPFQILPIYPGNIYVGGIDTGFVLDWR